MFTRLALKNFKNFENVTLHLGPFTLLIGANATGKSNIREAFRFLHGIGRGYSLPEIFGEKYSPGGEKQWDGIRGGLTEITFNQRRKLYVEVDFTHDSDRLRYTIQANVNRFGPTVDWEEFTQDLPQTTKPQKERIKPGEDNWSLPTVTDTQQLKQNYKHGNFFGQYSQRAVATLQSMRFIDLLPSAMRIPSVPGQLTLGSRGENLSSILHAICQKKGNKQILFDWIRELTPMDVINFEFPSDQVGRILVTLVEASGKRTSAYSASDGTLRFLAILAALLGPNAARFYFFEEIENGIHPSRLHLLTQLMEQITEDRNIQIVASTHSPQLLDMVSEKTLANAALLYRLEDQVAANIKRVSDIPDAIRLTNGQGIGELHASGWFENVMHFMNGGDKEVEKGLPV